ncbi:MAG: AbrB/MazE/SpoVT family DNA-binding domain-containing protein [Nanoarchaeota archaeon]|nr:AbrB/MazE/SpoVT family DNA-binding domain-containing protein [Nanoarchaeota archaeon]
MPRIIKKKGEWKDRSGRVFVEKAELLKALKQAERFKGSTKTFLRKWGNSTAIRIPKRHLEEIRVKQDDSALVYTEGDKIIISKT